MRPFFVAVLFVAGLLAVTATSPAEEPTCEGDNDEEACGDRCDEIVAALHEPLPTPAPTVGTCFIRDGVLGCACREVVAGEGEGEGEGERVDEGADFFVSDGACAAVSRLGVCLVPPDSFPGCDTANPTASCVEVCAVLDRQRADDIAAVDDAAVAQSGCDFFCGCTITARDRCLSLRIYDPHRSVTPDAGRGASNMEFRDSDSCDAP